MGQKVAAFIYFIHNLQRDEEQEASLQGEGKQNVPLPTSSSHDLVLKPQLNHLDG